MKYDIKVNGNCIGGRQGWAYVLNGGEIPVLRADMDKEQEYETYKRFGGVRVVWNYRGREHYHDTTLAQDERGWELVSGATFLSATFGYEDFMECLEASQTPIVRRDGVVAIATYSDIFRTASVRLYKVGRIDINCITCARLEPLTDEEMSEIVKKVERWCD